MDNKWKKCNVSILKREFNAELVIYHIAELKPLDETFLSDVPLLSVIWDVNEFSAQNCCLRNECEISKIRSSYS